LRIVETPSLRLLYEITRGGVHARSDLHGAVQWPNPRTDLNQQGRESVEHRGWITLGHQPPDGGAVGHRDGLIVAGNRPIQREFEQLNLASDRGEHGLAPVLPGLISVGDAICTTTPLAGRAVALALTQARELVRILDLHDRDITTATKQFDRWTLRHIRPWFEDHRRTDTDRMRRWSGGDIDVSRRLPSDLIVAAAEADPSLKDLVGPYTFMDALPASLAPAQACAREVYASGWRPRVPDGPTREQLSSVVSRTPTAA
jgi:hypothetical protein